MALCQTRREVCCWGEWAVQQTVKPPFSHVYFSYFTICLLLNLSSEMIALSSANVHSLLALSAFDVVTSPYNIKPSLYRDNNDLRDLYPISVVTALVNYYSLFPPPSLILCHAHKLPNVYNLISWYHLVTMLMFTNTVQYIYIYAVIYSLMCLSR